MTNRFAYHGHTMPDWMARTLPDHLVIHDTTDRGGTFAGVLIVRRRTELYVPVPPAIPRPRRSDAA